MKKTELNYSERLTVRRALERYAERLSAVKDAHDGSSELEKEQCERLQWLFKDATKIEITEE